MSANFTAEHARIYDTIYSTKDYANECGLLQRAFDEFSSKPVRRVIDLGCGTGTHAVALASRGLEVLGVDRSTEMLRIAAEKVAHAGLSEQVRFQLGDIAAPVSARGFDAALMMFNVIGYLDSDAALGSALGSARATLRDGGLLIVDGWRAEAMRDSPPVLREQDLVQDGRRIRRRSLAVINADGKSCIVHIELSELGTEVPRVFASEDHRVRGFEEGELATHLQAAGFDLLRQGDFPDYRKPPPPHAWTFMAIARAR